MKATAGADPGKYTVTKILRIDSRSDAQFSAIETCVMPPPSVVDRA
jgi:hypothetical protein